MKKQITHISILQSSKVLALVYFVLFAIIFIPLGLIALLTEPLKDALVLFIMPFVYLIISFITCIILIATYNFVAGYLGGVEFSLGDVEEKEITPPQ
jgi:hypothetical protein